MHIFFDTVWKLHIGEIPENPVHGPYKPLAVFNRDMLKYNEAIAAIKQNALTVGNPHLIQKIIPLPIGTSYKKDHFYPLPNGWDNVEMAVTLKTIHQYSPHTQDLLRLLKRLGASGSVATPKEESNVTQYFREDDEKNMNEMVDRIFEAERKEKEYLKSLQSELTLLRQQLKEREEALKELLPISEKGLNVAIQILGYLPNDTDRQYEVEEIKAIIERARKLLSK